MPQGKQPVESVFAVKIIIGPVAVETAGGVPEGVDEEAATIVLDDWSVDSLETVIQDFSVTIDPTVNPNRRLTVETTVECGDDVWTEELFVQVGEPSEAQLTLEVLEMAIDPLTPTNVRISLIAALAYLIMPLDLFPDFMPVVGFSDDFVALTAVLSIWSKYMTPSIRIRAEEKLNKLFPF